MEQIHAGGDGAANLDPGQRTAPGVNFAHFHPTLGAELLKRGKAAEIWDIFIFSPQRYQHANLWLLFKGFVMIASR